MGFGGFYSGGDSQSSTTNNNQRYDYSTDLTDESDQSVNTTTQSGVAAGRDLVYNVTDGGAMNVAGRVLESGMAGLTRNIDTAFVAGQNLVDSVGRVLINGQLQQLKSAGESASATSQMSSNAIAAMASLKGDSSATIGRFMPLLFAVVALVAVYVFTGKK